METEDTYSRGLQLIQILEEAVTRRLIDGDGTAPCPSAQKPQIISVVPACTPGTVVQRRSACCLLFLHEKPGVHRASVTTPRDSRSQSIPDNGVNVSLSSISNHYLRQLELRRDVYFFNTNLEFFLTCCKYLQIYSSFLYITIFSNEISKKEVNIFVDMYCFQLM